MAQSVLRRLGVSRCYEPAVFQRRPDWRINRLLKFTVADRLLAEADFTFMQIGAYDGIGDDDLRELICRHRLRGVVVEPQPEAFARLVETYRDQPEVTPLCAAISETNGMRTLYCPQTGDAMTASFDRRHLLKHGYAASEIVARQVVCHTVASALAIVGIDRLDLLQIDAEGYDHQIIQSIDFGVVQPAILRFEYRHMPPREADRCLELLAGWGYRFVVEENDIIAQRTCQTSGSRRAA